MGLPEVNVTFSVIVPSSGRTSLDRTLASITSQMQHGDELLCDVNRDGDWGNSARTRMLRKATRSHLLMLDDDDVYVPGAFALIRSVLADEPGRPQMFRMVYADDRVLFHNPVIEINNVSTQMAILPNIQSRLPDWGTEYAADFDFIHDACMNLGAPRWHNDIICRIRPNP